MRTRDRTPRLLFADGLPVGGYRDGQQRDGRRRSHPAGRWSRPRGARTGVVGTASLDVLPGALSFASTTRPTALVRRPERSQGADCKPGPARRSGRHGPSRQRAYEDHARSGLPSRAAPTKYGAHHAAERNPRASRHHRPRPRARRRARQPERAPRPPARLRRDGRRALRALAQRTILPTPSGSIATASSSRRDTARCSSTRGCT